jgi:predicted deacylase
VTRVERATIRFDSPLLREVELPRFDVRGRDGPTLALIAGVHGCEYSSIAAVGEVVRRLEGQELAGRVLAVPVVNVSAFRMRTPFVTPEDGKNLNRCFPGRADGSYSEALADGVFEQVIAASDYTIDLHGGDLVEALEPFVLYDESPVEEAARAMAAAFGLRYAVCSPRAERIEGTTVAAAADAGIPALVAEAGGRGLLEADAVRALAGGVENVLRALGMVPGEPRPAPAGAMLFRRFTWLYSPVAGWWQPSVDVGERVSAGSALGRVRDLLGDELAEIAAPADGVVLFMTSVPPVDEGSILLGLGAGPSPLEP